MSEIVITKNNFEEEVIKSDVPVLIDFWATWCGPCKMIAPIVEELSKEFEGKIKVGKVNVDNEGELAIQFGVMSIPTLIYFVGGEIRETLIGYRSKEEIIKELGL